MMKKKFTALLAVTALSIGLLTGCGKGPEEGPASQGAGEESKVEESSTPEDSGEETEPSGTQEPGEVVNLKWIQVGTGTPANYKDWLEQVNPYLEEKIGVNLDVEIVPWADWDNRRSVIVNAGEYFDILFTDQGRYNAEVALGALMDITDLVKTAAPDLYGMIPEDYWQAASVDGKVYGVPTYKDSSATNYYIWDRAVAEQYDIDYENIHDFEALYEVLKEVKEEENTSPYYMSKGGASFLTYPYYDELGAGLPVLGVRYDDTSKTVVNPLADEAVMKQMDYVHKMYKEGIINGDAPNADDSEKYKIFFTAQGWSRAAETQWGPKNGIDDCVAIQYSDTVISNTTVRGSMSAIYSGCKNPEKALALLELVNTDSKVRDWLYYGVEGDNFEYTDDGKIHKLNQDWTMAGYTQGTFFNVTQLDTEEFNQWDEVKELNANASPSVMLGFDMDLKNVETEIANCRAVYEKYKDEFWTGARDPRELIEVIQGELDTAGWETIRAEAQAQIDAAN